MTTTFWRQVHGASTHFPIVLLLASLVFDLSAWRVRDEGLRRGLHAAGFGSMVVGALGGGVAGIAGLVLTRGRVLGGGNERVHHLFVWPALAACIAFAAWRLFRRGRLGHRGLGLYFAAMSVTVLLMMGAGYSGGEMVLSEETASAAGLSPSGLAPVPNTPLATANRGQTLFLKNCAHCHGADAHGDEAPDLHKLDWSDEQIARRIRNGKRGQMPAFAGKLSQESINEVIGYLRTLE